VAGRPLDDPRVTVAVADVYALIRAGAATYDAILLDVDNGPSALSQPANGWLYTLAGLAAAHAALVPGGVLGVWSAYADAGFKRRLQRAGFDAEVRNVRARGRQGGPVHVIWIGSK
jgi:spermidine synthase